MYYLICVFVNSGLVLIPDHFSLVCGASWWNLLGFCHHYCFWLPLPQGWYCMAFGLNMRRVIDMWDIIRETMMVNSWMCDCMYLQDLSQVQWVWRYLMLWHLQACSSGASDRVPRSRTWWEHLHLNTLLWLDITKHYHDLFSEILVNFNEYCRTGSAYIVKENIK